MQAAMQPTGPEDHHRPEPPSLAAVSAAFPQLEILGLIGYGGMGAVFKARQPKLDRLVALKLLPASLAERDASFEGRFEREGRLLARLHHPNIVAVHDSGTAGGFFYLLMEFVEGVNLRQAMRSRRFTPAQALAIVPHICDAMQFAHDEGVLHRDIKPENILLDGKGRVKLADFGIAKLMGDGMPEAPIPDEPGATPAPQTDFTQSGATLGTPSYMAPEQRDTPGAVDHRADIYSLGVVFYELLTGELPTASFVPPSTKSEADPRVDAIVAQALEKERTRRQSSAGEVKTQVETVVQEKGSSRSTGRVLRAGNGIAATPEQLATASGQMFLYRKKTHLQITDREFIYTQNGVPVVVPHTAIQDVSIGHLPRVINWAGLDVMSVTHEDSGALKQVFFLPQEGILGMPSDINRHVAEWADALRAAVKGKTGRPPKTTPADQLGMPSGAAGFKSLMLIPLLFAALAIFVVFNAPGGSVIHTSALISAIWMIAIPLGVLGVVVFVFGRHHLPVAPRRALALGCLGLVSFAVMALGGVWLMAKSERAAVQVSQARLRQAEVQAAPPPVIPVSIVPKTIDQRSLRHSYERMLTELLDTRLERELDALRPESERQGEVLARKEKKLAEEVERLRTGIEAAPPPAKPAFTDEIGIRR
jgi:serine/threonine protein kinase